MKSIVGLVEYTVTGGFFWILLLLFSPVFGINTQIWLDALPSVAGQLTPAAKDSISIIVTGIIFIGIFTTGLLLDIVAPVIFSVCEIRWARKALLEKQGGWFTELINEYHELVADDYRALTTHGNRWTPRSWRVGSYWGLIFFLISYSLSTAKGGQQEEIFDRLKVWRVSRALSVSLFTMSILLSIWAIYESTNLELFSTFKIGVFVPWILFVVSMLMSQATFSRLIAALRAAAYLSWVESRHSKSAQKVNFLAADNLAGEKIQAPK